MADLQHDFNSSKHFLSAARNGSKTVLPLFFRHASNLNLNAVDTEGIPALWHILRATSGQGNHPFVKQMLDLGADPTLYFNNKQGIRSNFLIEACLYKNLPLIEAIGKHPDFDADFKRSDGMTAVTACLKSGFEVGLNVLLKNFNVEVEKDLLFQSLDMKQWGIFSRLVKDSSVDLSFYNEDGETILHSIVKNHSFVLAFAPAFEKFKSAVDFNTRDHLGNTALFYALEASKRQFAYYLIKNGADITLDYDTKTGVEMEQKLFEVLNQTSNFIERSWPEEIKNIIEVFKTKKLLEDSITKTLPIDSNASKEKKSSSFKL